MPDKQNPLSGDDAKAGPRYPGNTHAVYGLKQYWRYGRSTFDGDQVVRIGWTGKARGLLEQRAIEVYEERSPNGVAVVTLRSPKTRVVVTTIPEAKALYALLTGLLQSRSITDRQRKTFHRVRDELVDGVRENFDRVSVDDLKGGADASDFDRARERQRERADGSSVVSFEEDVFEK